MIIERQQEITGETHQQGRDFLEVLKSAPKYDQKWRIEAMQEGDYINMSGKEFKRWVSFIPVNEEALGRLNEIDEVKVEIKEIIKTKDGNNNTIVNLLVEGEGVCKKIDASLFYNYGGIRYIDKELEGSIFFSTSIGPTSNDYGDENIKK